jgi:hypothetical protein
MQKITKEFCKGKTLLFHPETEAEAEFIQRSLFKMGFCWDTGKILPHNLKQCCETGLILWSEDNRIYTTFGAQTRKKSTVCTSAQFDPPFAQTVLQLSTNSDPMALILQEFNKMAGRFDQLSSEVTELRQEVAALHAEISPKHLLKDKF